jgi:hypothetical protein
MLLAEIDWVMVGAIGQWAGAIATFAAVVVALWTARLSSAVRLKVKGALAATDRGRGVEWYIIASAVNLSHRPVTVSGAGFVLPNDGHQMYPSASLDGTLPMILSEGARVQLFFPCPEIAEELLKLGYKDRTKLKVFFDDAAGGRHCRSFRFSPNKWIGRR